MQADIANRGLAHRTEFELDAVKSRPERRTSPARPVRLGQGERTFVPAIFVIQPDESSSGAVSRMADVVDLVAVAIVPRPWNLDGADVILDERTVELTTGLFLKRDPDRMFKHQKTERVRERIL